MLWAAKCIGCWALPQAGEPFGHRASKETSEI